MAKVYHTAQEVLAPDVRSSPGFGPIRIHLIEAAERILPALPARLSSAASAQLVSKGVAAFTHAKISDVKQDAVYPSDGRVITAEITVWAASIEAPGFLKEIVALSQIV